MFRLLLSNCVDLVRKINAVRYNNYCNALTFLGFSLYLTSQLTFALVMFTNDGLLGADRCTNLMQRPSFSGSGSVPIDQFSF